MPDSRIKDLPALPVVATSDFVPIDSLTGTRRTTVADILALGGGGGGTLFRNVAHADSPYSLPPAPDTTVTVDCSDGNVSVDLPFRPPVGTRVTVKDVTPAGVVPGGHITVHGGTSGRLQDFIDDSTFYPSRIVFGVIYSSVTLVYAPKTTRGSDPFNSWSVVAYYPGISGAPP
jgi:hypothetical protein